MQLFNIRHGLLAYAPVWILGMAGLVAGAWRGTPFARQGLLLAAVAALTGVGVNPGEGWPARFWVLSVPMLALGLSIWIGMARGTLARAVLVLLAAITLLNTALFFLEPNSFLENRETTTTYQHLFDAGLPFHFGLLLPTELPDPASRALVLRLLLGFGVLLLLGIGAALRPGPRFALPMLLVLAAGLELSLARTLPADTYAVRTGDGSVQLDLILPRPVVALQFGRNWEAWTMPTPHGLELAVTLADGTVVNRSVPANQVISLRCFGPIAALRLSSPTGLDPVPQAAHRLRLYRPASRLGYRLTRLGLGCR